MSITVICPGCSAELNAPDSAAGKKVKCPKVGCGALMIIPETHPAEPQAEEEPSPRRDDDDDDDRPRSRRRRDDNEDDSDDRPRRKKRKRAAGLAPGLIAAIAILGLLLVAGAGVGVYLIVNKKNVDAAAKNGDNTGGGGRAKAPIPTGWVPFTSPSKSFKAYFPKHPVGTNASSGGNEVEMAILGGPKERLAAIVVALKLPQGAGINQDQLAELMRQGVMKKQGRMRLVSQRSVTWLGRAGLEMTFEQANNMKGTLLVRQLTTDKYMYFAFFGDSTGRPSPDEENGFFDNFEIHG